MKIVIDIPDEDYDTLINHNDDRLPAVIARLRLFEVIKNGTPLPKGHGRLIDADALVTKGDVTKSYLSIFAPTIIEADKEN